MSFTDSIGGLLSTADTNETVILLHRDHLVPDDNQSRQIIDEEHVARIAASMALEIKDPDNPQRSKRYGVRTPLVVEKQSNNTYLIVNGHNRWLAAAKAGLDELPCIVKQYQDDKERRFDHIGENTLRQNLNLYDLAVAMQQDLDHGLTRDQVATIYNLKSPAKISKYLAVLKADPIIQESTKAGQIADVNTIYELKSLKPDNLEKWKKLIDRGESARGAYTKVAPKKKKPGRPSTAKATLSLNLNQLNQLLALIGQTERCSSVIEAKQQIMEKLNG